MIAGKRRRTLLLALTIVAATLVMASVAGWALAPELAERIALAELERRGVPSPQLRISRLSLTGAEIADLRIGDEGEVKVERIAVDYSLRGLVERRVERIELIRPTIRLTADSKGISLGSLDALLRRRSGEGDDVPGDSNARPRTRSPLPSLPQIALREARIEAITPAGPVAIVVDGDIEPTPEHTSGRFSIGIDTSDLRYAGTLDIEAKPSATTLRFDLSDEGGGTIRALAAVPDTARSAGIVEMHAERLRIPGLARAVSGRGELAVTWGRDGIFLNAGNGAYVEIGLDPEILAGIPARQLSLIGTGATISAEPGLLLARKGDGEIQLKGRLSIAGMGPQTVRATFDVDMAGPPRAPRGRLYSSVALKRFDFGNLRVSDLKLTLPLDAAVGDSGQIELRLAEPGSLDAAGIAVRGKVETRRPIKLPLLPRDDIPLLRIERGPTASASRSAALRIGKAAISLALVPNPVRFEGGWESIDLGYDSDAANGSTREVRLTGGFARAPDHAWAAEGIAAHLQPDGPGAEIAFTANRVVQQRKPPMIVPLRVSGTVTLERSDVSGSSVRFTVRGEDAGKRLIVESRGEHSITHLSGRADFTIRPIEMSADRLQPKDLFPGIELGVDSVEGAVALAGSANWKSGAVRSDANLLVRDVSFEKSGVRVERLNGVVAVDNLVPLSTKPDQRLAVAAVQAGVPMTDGLITFEVRDGRVLRIRDARLALAGGNVSVNEATLTANPQRQMIPLHVTGVDLGPLLDLAGLDGLTGSGRLSGTIPVTLEGGDVEISDGTLTAEGPGKIGYDPASPPAALRGGGEQVALALSALKDFHYDRLRITLDRKLGGETAIGMHIAGRNPGFYDGYPVEFNLNLTGKLDQILRRGLAGYRLPDEIRKRLESFPTTP